MAEGRFRANLDYRLNVYPIHLPALRERVDDIPRLVWFFIHRHQRHLGRHITKVPQALMTQLQQCTWPGNIRELENVVERSMILLDGRHPAARRSACRWIGGGRWAGGTENLEAVSASTSRQSSNDAAGGSTAEETRPSGWASTRTPCDSG